MASLSLPTTPNHLSSPSKPTKTRKSFHFPETHVAKSLEKPKTPQISNKFYFHRISSLCKEGLIQEAFALLTQIESASLSAGPEIYGELLQGCVYERAFSQGQQIHARILKNGTLFPRNEYLETKLLIFYAKCDRLSIAEELFLRKSQPNVFSWAAMIGLYCKNGSFGKALLGYCKMIEAGAFPDNFVIPNALKACSALQLIGYGRGIHGYVLKMGFDRCVFVLSSLVDFYGKCGVLEDARKVFEEMDERTVVSWNSMLVGFVQNGQNEEALENFYDMRIEGVQPTRVSIASFLSASANLEALDEGRQGHAIAIVSGLELDNILCSSTINFYCKVGLMEDAELIFNRTVDKDVVTWNLLISGYVQDGNIDKALNMCQRMKMESLKFDSVTLASILSACADSGNIELGKVGHGYCIRNNLESDLVIGSSIINLYASCGRIEYARRVFDVAIQRDLVLWNTIISTYAQCGLSGEALKLFYQMQLEGMPPNVVSWNSVILGFLRNGQVYEAQDMFLQMQFSGVNPNLITWTTLISGLAQNGFGYEAIQFFEQMQAIGLRPNVVTVVGVILACKNVASLLYGKAAHGHVMRRGILSSLSVTTSLVDMYAKCGSINLPKRIFEMVPNKGLPLYNAMISGYALHGQAEEALTLYKTVHQVGMEPDEITFTALLSACSHAGLACEGLRVLAEMISVYNIKPRMEHYGCVVTLLARSGYFKEALKVISAMPFEPDAHILGSLLDLCKEHHEIELGEYLSRHLFKLEPENIGNYVTLSSTYAASGRWDAALKVRELMKESGLKKNPGRSWIQIGSGLHTFVAGDRSHPLADRIYEALVCLDREMKFAGCAPRIINNEQSDVREETLSEASKYKSS